VGHRWGDLLRIARRNNIDNGSVAAYLSNVLGKAKGISATPETFLPWRKGD
jgi:hypothetical protein